MADPEGGSGARVCVCGYDLAGLALDADTKCPECGANAQDSARIRASRAKTRPVLVDVFAPTGMVAVCTLLALFPHALVLPLVLAVAGLFVAAVWLCTVTPVACTRWVQSRLAEMPVFHRGLVSLAVATGVVLMNIALSVIIVMAADALFY